MKTSLNLNVSNQPSFAARTFIAAPVSLLSKEESALLKAMGEKIGAKTDSISFSYKQNPQNPNVYGCSYSAMFTKKKQEKKMQASINVPISKMSPLDYGKKIMNKLAVFYKESK